MSFSLPENLGELQEITGGVGGCVSVGYSLLDSQDPQGNFSCFFCLNFSIIYFFPIGVPTASLTFYAINCTNGEWYLIVLCPLTNNNNEKKDSPSIFIQTITITTKIISTIGKKSQ